MTVSTLRVVPETTVSGTAPYAEALAFAMRRPKLLDLCCGAGGASTGYHAAGFDVYGVDIAPPVAVYGSYGQRSGRRHDQPEDVSTDQARAAMGIDWMPWPALTQAIPPAYTFWLGVQLFARLRDVTLPAPAGFVTKSAAVTSPDVQGGYVTTPAGLRHCPCGNPLPARPGTGRWPRYCSHAARLAAYRHRTRAVAS